MLSQLASDGRPLFVADAGNMFWKAPVVPAGLDEETRVKAQLQAESLQRGGIDAMLPSEGDWALGRDFVLQMAKDHQLPYVAGNLSCDAPLPFPAHRVVERGGLRVAFVGAVPPNIQVEGCRPDDPSKAIAAAVAERADLVVLLSGQRREEDENLLRRTDGVDLVVNGKERTLSAAGESMPKGAAWVGGGQRGKQVVVLEAELVPGATGWEDDSALEQLRQGKDRYANRLAELKKRLSAAKDDAERQRLETQVGFFEKQLVEAGQKLEVAEAQKVGVRNRLSIRPAELDEAVADEPGVAALVATAKQKLSGGAAPVAPKSAFKKFVGSEACAPCHTAETAQWKGTGHAHAWATLVKETRQGERECASCHSTGAMHPDGPQALADMIPDVGCESCHGPGLDHSQQPTVVNMTKDPPEQVCVACHDAKNDGGRFNFGTYRPKVVHTAGGVVDPAAKSAM